MTSTGAALVRACHPFPTLVMTTLLTVLAWSVGWQLPALLGVTCAVLLGQLSIGWSNDAVDADLDARAGRTDKPTVAGLVAPPTLWRAAAAAAAACVLASIAVAGPWGGSFHVGFVAAAWAYNAGLSRTAWSWAPYAAGFACLPPFLVLGLDGSWPPAWMVVVLPLIGVAAHLANALPDLERDRAVGVGGAAVRLGRRRSTVLAWLLLATATAVLVTRAIGGSPVLTAIAALGYLAALGAGLLVRNPSAMFRAVVAAVALDAVILVLAS